MMIAYTETAALSTEEKFDWLYARRRDVQAYVVSLVGSQDAAEDIVQTVWLKVWKALPATGQVSYEWLRTIAANCAMDWLRKQATANKYLSGVALDDCEDAVEAPERDHPERVALAHERYAAIVVTVEEQALMRLASQQQTRRRRISISALAKEAGLPRREVDATMKRVRGRAQAERRGA